MKDYPTIVASPAKIKIQYTADEVKVFSFNSPPLFVDPLPANFTFNFTEPIVDLGPFSLGLVEDLEEDSFDVTFPNVDSFIEPIFDESSKEVTFKLSQNLTENGDFKLPIEVIQTVNGTESKSKYSVPIYVDGIPEQSAANDTDTEDQVANDTTDANETDVNVFVPDFKKKEKKKRPPAKRPEFDPPTMIIRDISRLGLVTVQFSEVMLIPDDALKEINTDVLNITLDASEENMQSLVGFTWKIIEFGST